jgi:hypothetical protein
MRIFFIKNHTAPKFIFEAVCYKKIKINIKTLTNLFFCQDKIFFLINKFSL